MGWRMQAQAASEEGAVADPGPVYVAAPGSSPAQDRALTLASRVGSDAEHASASQQTGLGEAAVAAGRAASERQADISVLSDRGLAVEHCASTEARGLSALACAQSIAWADLPPGCSSSQPEQADCGIPHDADVADECVVCWVSAASVVFQPCGHFCCCAGCAEPFLTGREAGCPMCRVPISAGICL